MSVNFPFKGPSASPVSDKFSQPKKNKAAAVGGGAVTEYTGKGFIFTFTDIDDEDYIINFTDHDGNDYILIGE